MPLTERRIGKLIQTGTPGRYLDRDGLYFRIAPGGSTGWVLRTRINGARVDRGLGSYPTVTLAEARIKAKANVVTLSRNGVVRTPKRRPSEGLTLREAVLRAHAVFKLDWKERSGDLWLSQLESHILPVLGARPVAEITGAEVLDALEPLYHTVPNTARRVRRNLRRVFAWAMAHGLRDDNPAGSERLDGALPRSRPQVKHHRYAHHSKVGDSIARVRAGSTAVATALAFELVLHTASRTVEVITWRWSDLNDVWTTWTIPAHVSKDKRAHRKPITRQVRSLLRTARAFQEQQGIASDFVLTTPQGERMGESTLRSLMHIYDIPHTIHGLRSTFRSWGAETGERWDVMEMQLSHAVGDPTVMAYYRTDLLELRAETMQRWSDYLDPADYWRDGFVRLIAPVEEEERSPRSTRPRGSRRVGGVGRLET